MTWPELYHYTDAESAAKIAADGEIRATPKTLYREADASDDGLETPPHVWLSVNPVLDGTIVAKLRLAGLTLADLARVVLPGDYCDVGLAEYADRLGVPPDSGWWDWVVRTGYLAGSDYTTWRVHDRDVPAADWLRVEVFDGISAGVSRWRPLAEGG